MPERDRARFVAQMEDVLDVYQSEHSEEFPLICMDEASKQLLEDEHPTVPMAPGRPRREDYHYQRRGTQALFMFFNPISGWRRVNCRDSRMRVDWAEEIRTLLEEDYPQAKRITLVCDNLNTHSIASLYAAFPASQAHALKQRLRMHFTPRNGSWLNVAEIELSVLSRQCLNRRIGSVRELQHALQRWQSDRNQDACKVRWQFNTENARTRLCRLYPQFWARLSSRLG